MKKRLSLFFLINMLFILPITSCNNSRISANLIKIALDIEDEGRYDELFSYFEEQNGIKVKATYGQDVSKLIGTKDEPDIIKTSTVALDAMRPSLKNLSPLIDTDASISADHYLDSIIEALTIDGHVYALPTSINTSLLYYNKTLFDESESELRLALELNEADSVYPQANWTYDDYQKAGVVLSKHQGTPPNVTYSTFGAETQLIWWGEWHVYLQQMGGSFYKPNTKNRISALDSQEAYDATYFFRNKSLGSVDEKFAPDAIESASSYSFLGGNVAMIFGGHMGDWYSYDAVGLDWDVQVLPKPAANPGAPGGEISADAFGISSRSKNVEQAFTFLKLWAGPEGALKMYKYGKIGALKNMKQLIDDLPQAEQKNINIDAVFAAIDEAVTLPREQDFSKVMREIVMSELYKLMFVGRGSESDIAAVLLRIKNSVDRYYAQLYGAN